LADLAPDSNPDRATAADHRPLVLELEAHPGPPEWTAPGIGDPPKAAVAGAAGSPRAVLRAQIRASLSPWLDRVRDLITSGVPHGLRGSLNPAFTALEDQAASIFTSWFAARAGVVSSDPRVAPPPIGASLSRLTIGPGFSLFVGGTLGGRIGSADELAIRAELNSTSPTALEAGGVALTWTHRFFGRGSLVIEAGHDPGRAGKERVALAFELRL
jgi:hypothetical protein